MIACDQMLKKAEYFKISVKTVVEPVAAALGNTPAISRKSYVHPKLLDAVKEDPRDPLKGMDRPTRRKRLSSSEVALSDFLTKKAKHRRRTKAASLQLKDSLWPLDCVNFPSQDAQTMGDHLVLNGIEANRDRLVIGVFVALLLVAVMVVAEGSVARP